jgi:hypothetical protein
MTRMPSSQESSKLQSVVAKSTAEAEYVAVSEAAREALHHRVLFADTHSITFTPTSSTNILCDNTAAMLWSEHDMAHERTKHIDVCHHHVRDLIYKKIIAIKRVTTHLNLADGFTEPLLQTLLRLECSRREGRLQDQCP